MTACDGCHLSFDLALAGSWLTPAFMRPVQAECPPILAAQLWAALF